MLRPHASYDFKIFQCKIVHMGWAGTADRRAVIMDDFQPGPKNFGRKFWVAKYFKPKDLGLDIWGNAKNAADKA